MQINGIELFVEALGEGPLIITIHGGLGLDHTHYRPWLDPLAEHFKVLYYDQRSNGRSTIVPDEELTLDTLTDDVEALRLQFSPDKPCIILGHSYGGFVALNYALKYPDALSHLILVNTCAYFDEAKAQQRMHKTNIPPEILDEFNSDWGTDENLAKHFDKIGRINFMNLNKELSDKVFAHTQYRAQARQRAFELLEHYDMRPQLKNITTKTLVICGDKDIILPLELSEELANNIPNATLSIFTQSAHFPYVEQPQLFIDTVNQWLS